MKLPFEFGVKLFFRLVLPGFFLALGFSPVLFTLTDSVALSGQKEFALILLTILMGWLIIVLDMPIYMLFEGRRYWPDSVRKYFLHLEQKRLKRIKSKIPIAEPKERKDYQDYLEASVEIRKFPFNERGYYRALFPSRLGNLIYAYELYSDERYGMDVAFYWPRIWVKLDKDLREEMDNQQALADSAVYTSFASIMAGILWLVYSALSTYSVTVVKYIPSAGLSWAIAFVFLILGFCFYRASIHIYGQYGESFKAIIDVYGKDIDVSDVVMQVDKLLKRPASVHDRQEELFIAWRYLHNYSVKCPSCGKVMPVPEVSKHHCGFS